MTNIRDLELRIKDDVKAAVLVALALENCIRRNGVTEDAKECIDRLRVLGINIESDFYHWRSLPAESWSK